MQAETVMLCPYCGDTVPDDEVICPSCHEDLSGLVHLERQYQILYNEAIGAVRAGQLDEAISALKLTQRANPEFAPAHMLLAKIHANRGEWMEARAAVTEAVRVSPGDHTVLDLAREIVSMEESTSASSAQTVAIKARVPVSDAPAPRSASFDQEVGAVAAFAIGASLVALYAFVRSLFLN